MFHKKFGEYKVTDTFALSFQKKIYVGEHQSIHNKLSLAGLLVTLGIIFGDIGTSPLYVLLINRSLFIFLALV